MPYRDDFGRAINYLRISVTDRCNLRCVYCMPAEGIEKAHHSKVLTYEEIAIITRAAAELGICKVRLTGGEPLARLGLTSLIGKISAIPCVDDLSMTTNGILLARHAQALADAGMQRVNISLDSLRPERFAQITRRNRIDDVWAGIKAAEAAGLEPIKINMVVIRGLNDDEVVDFARRTVTEGWHVRYIELMPIGVSADWSGDGSISIPEIRERIETGIGPLTPVRGPTGNGPARYYQLPGAAGTIGFVGAFSDHICQRCNRLRLTADGRLRPCLMSSHEIDLRGPLRAGAGLEAIKELIIRAVHSKPQRHHLDEAQAPRDRTMAQIGG